VEDSGLRMILSPAAKEAIATARIVCDLEVGIATVPLSRDFFTISFINYRVSYYAHSPQRVPAFVAVSAE
jgi:hypothetical protein